MKTLVILVLLVGIPAMNTHAFGGAPVTVGGTDSSDSGQTESPVPDESSGDAEGDNGSSTGVTTVTDFFGKALEFMEEGVYDWADSVLERVTAWYIIWNLEMQLMLLEVAAHMADSVIQSFDISGKIEQLMGAIDSKLLAFVVWLRIPEALSMMLSAHIVRFILQIL